MNRQLSGKSFILSMVSILVVGLAAIFFFYYLLYKTGPQASWQVGSPVTTKPISFNLEITSPDDNLLTFEKSVVTSGKTSPHSPVIISTDTADFSQETDNAGEFSKVINLDKGLNHLTITAFDQLGNLKKATRTVFYSEEKI